MLSSHCRAVGIRCFSRSSVLFSSSFSFLVRSVSALSDRFGLRKSKVAKTDTRLPSDHSHRDLLVAKRFGGAVFHYFLYNEHHQLMKTSNSMFQGMHDDPAVATQLFAKFSECVAVLQDKFHICRKDPKQSTAFRSLPAVISHSVYEHGMLFEVPSSKRSKPREPKDLDSGSLSYWVVGRLHARTNMSSSHDPTADELYICFRDGTSHNIVESMFKLHFGSSA
eukprot:m.533243 g.533243  ORF g.533243 m.533243 type:complete len:223 (+) comp57598_c1_seq30:3166-3834(+)